MALAADVVLGLTAKAEQVFTGDDVRRGNEIFLSFPLAVVPFAAQHLAEVGLLSSSTAAAQTAADFARIVNSIPRGRLWQPSDGMYLWEVIQKVFSEAEVASVPETDDELAEYTQARNLLYDTLDDGSLVESAALLAYRQHRDAWFVATQELANRRGDAVRAGGETLQQFEEVEEPKLHAVIAEVEQHWLGEGRRLDIENAQQTMQRRYDRSPTTAWATFMARFDPDLTMLDTPVGGGRYAPTGLLPATVAESEWPTIHLDRAQLDALAAGADEDLRRRLGGDSDRNVLEVTFEYTSVSVQRPWFSPELLDARYWRLPAGVEPLSDGADPPNGLCPAYVTALALARNISVVRRSGSAAESSRKADFGFLGGARLRPVSAPTNFVAKVTASLRAAVLSTPIISSHRSATVRDHRKRTTPATGVTVVRDHRKPTRSTTRATSRVAVGRLPLNNVVLARPATRPVETSSVQTTKDATPPEEIYVLALICRKLARTPNPDPALFESAVPDERSPN